MPGMASQAACCAALLRVGAGAGGAGGAARSGL